MKVKGIAIGAMLLVALFVRHPDHERDELLQATMRTMEECERLKAENARLREQLYKQIEAPKPRRETSRTA